jgi:hypothetical protein
MKFLWKIWSWHVENHHNYHRLQLSIISLLKSQYYSRWWKIYIISKLENEFIFWKIIIIIRFCQCVNWPKATVKGMFFHRKYSPDFCFYTRGSESHKLKFPRGRPQVSLGISQKRPELHKIIKHVMGCHPSSIHRACFTGALHWVTLPQSEEFWK